MVLSCLEPNPGLTLSSRPPITSRPTLLPELISELARQLRGHLADGGETAVVQALCRLQSVLGPHLEKEETGLFAQLAEKGGFEWYLGQLNADHARARSTLLREGPLSPRPAAELLAALDELAAHIEVEEYDLFPASRVILDEAA